VQFREYGPGTGPPVVVLHGGPGAIGSAGSLARLVADPAHVLEPWQRATTVADHIGDLHAFVTARCDRLPVLVGHSWGAMLALAYAAAHPTAAVCLVGCGTFDLAARAVFESRLAKRLPPGADALPRDQRFALVDRAYLIDPVPDDPLDDVEVEPRLDDASWSDMLRLQADGTYPAAFARIDVPIMMLHGADDPHPGELIRASLAPHLPQLEYREWDRCGHYPWRERAVRDDFGRILRAWLTRNPAQWRG
jgi:pimeloyl-ACP methyl ester carboxylesterase